MNKQKFSAKFLMIASFIFAVLLLTTTIFAAAGDVDTTFSASAYGNNQGGNIGVIKKQNDGKVLIGGFFTSINGIARSGIARLNADGSIDDSFNPPDFFSGLGLGSTIYAIALQSDGKILVGGSIYGVSNVFSPGLKRLNPDGSLDQTFSSPFINDASTIIYDIEVLPDDKIVIGGTFRFSINESNRSVARLNADGSLDSSFQYVDSNPVKDLLVLPDGKVLAGGVNLIRYNSDGTTDDSFASGSVSGIEEIKYQSDGKVIISGSFSTVNGFPQGRIARINSDGSLDLNFNLNGVGADGSIFDFEIKPDGKIIIVGRFFIFNNVPRTYIAQLNADGTLDTSFENNNAIAAGTLVNEAEILSDGKILVGTNHSNSSILEPRPVLYKFNSDGTSDPIPHYLVSRYGIVREVLQQPDGKILIAGEYYYANGEFRKGLARVNSDGSLDTSFVAYFSNQNLGYLITCVDLQSDGKVLVGSNTNLIKFKRLNSDGSLDTSYNPPFTSSTTTIADIAVQSDDKSIVVGNLALNTGQRVIARFNLDGSIDGTFTSLTTNGSINKVIVEPDGKIIIAGEFTQIGASLRGRIARLNSDGTLDNTFNPPGGANGAVSAIDLQSDGKIIVGGSFTSLNGNNSTVRIGRYNSDGTLDTSFIQTVNASIYAVKVQPDGKILIGGSLSEVGNVAKNNIARLNSNGSLDSTFNTSANNYVWTINLQSDGKILVGGNFTKLNQLSNVGVGRLLNNINAVQSTPFDFDGDGRSDISVFRSSTNRWYEILSGNSTIFETTFGVAGDVIVPADFDGDGKTDLAIFRPSSGDWWYQSSLDNTLNNIQFGASGDIPRPSDFDGDGKADFIVFRPSDNVWYRSGSTGEVSITSFGAAGDKPLVGDFDGDGKSDVAIYRPSTGTWWYQSSFNNAQIATGFGVATDIPVPADYDGDGKTDIAVYRPSTGVWYILNSSTGQATIVHFGVSEDKPVAADYDGDGKADIAVFRPSSGVWYLLKTTEGFAALQFGVSTDIPLPNAFIQ